MPTLKASTSWFRPSSALLLASLLLGGCETAPSVGGIAEPVINDVPVAAASGVEESPEVAAISDDLWQHIRSGYGLSPAQMHETVAKQINWYQRNPNYLKTVFGRAEPFIFYVTDELDKAGLPLELALLPIVESTYDPLAYSHSHAVGLWQFIPSTARSFGLHRDRWYDGRRDVVRSTQAAIKYLKYLHRRFDNDWLLALAAYNSGEGNVRKSMTRNRKLGKPVDFWSIKLPRETRNYVPQLLALAALIEKPEQYKIVLPSIKDSPYFEMVEIKSQIDLNKIIEISKIKGEDFTRLNPAYRRSITPPQGSYNILLPLGGAEPLRELLATTDPRSWVPYTEYSVASGDTLSEIAQRFKISTAQLKARNNMGSDRLRIGQVLYIPQSGKGPLLSNPDGATQKSVYLVQRGDSLSTIALRFKTTAASLKQSNNLSTDVLQIGQKLVVQHSAAIPSTDNTRRLSYRVRRGDSLYLIAEKFDLNIRDITRWNKISRHEYLQPGQRLTLFINALRI
ncbi:MAG: LysM peptidoglycan-binding domain-containing protein [Porticoccaceae bacterium]